MLHLHQEDKARFASENKTALMERFAGTTADQACPFLLPVLPTQGFARDSQPFRCAIYDDRPLVCREFEIGGRHCRELRAKRGLPI
jgi:Fe-S-cluster containining protein